MRTSTDQAIETILARRSIRVYSPGAVTDEQVNALLRAAMAAPSAMTKDPWRFVDISSGDTLKTLAAALPGGGMLATAARAILVCGDLDAAFERSVGYLIQDCSAAIENLLIAAQNLGLGACWVGVYPSEPAMRKMAQTFGLPPTIIPVAVISLGIPGEAPEPRTRFQSSYIHRELW